jgi:hypothetical protein
MTITDIPSSDPDHKRIIQALENGKCPDCQNSAIVPGPRGGLSRNVSCDACGSRFNVAPWYPGRISHRFLFVQRIE